MRFIKIELMYKDKVQGSYIEKFGNVSISALTDGMEPGSDSYRISVVEMEEEEFYELPEFTGF